MIIECPACKSRYRIREEKLPAAGGNIKCPSCAHVFFVARDVVPAAPAPPVTTTGASGQTDPNGWSQIPLGDSASASGGAPAAATASAGGTLAMAAVNETSPPRAVPLSPPTAADGGPKKWKLRNAVGLVYDFTDSEQLVKWLGTKESHEGMQASEDGGVTFRELSEFSALRDVRPSRKTMMGLPAVVSPPVNAGPPVAAPATRTGEFTVDAKAAVATATGLQETAANTARPADQSVMQQQAQARLDQARRARGAEVTQPMKTDKPAARTSGKSGVGATGATSGSRLPSNNLRRERNDEQGSWLGLIGVLSIPLVIAGIVQVTGLFDFRQLLGGPREQVGVLPLPGNSLPAVDQSTAQNNYIQPVQLSSAQQAAMAIDAAAAAVAQERFEEATGHLERAAFLAPERIELQCQLADLYARTSRPADAARTRARCNGTDATSGSGAALPADGSSPSAEGSTANPAGSPAPETGPN